MKSFSYMTIWSRSWCCGEGADKWVSMGLKVVGKREHHEGGENDQFYRDY